MWMIARAIFEFNRMNNLIIYLIVPFLNNKPSFRKSKHAFQSAIR